MLDGGEADDKIIAVLANDPIWGHVTEVGEVPAALVERLRHYFLTYKATPGREARVSLGATYGRTHAEAVIAAAAEDYGAPRADGADELPGTLARACLNT